jgi:membrane protein involved in colicin uptake
MICIASIRMLHVKNSIDNNRRFDYAIVVDSDDVVEQLWHSTKSTTKLRKEKRKKKKKRKREIDYYTMNAHEEKYSDREREREREQIRMRTWTKFEYH